MRALDLRRLDPARLGALCVKLRAPATGGADELVDRLVSLGLAYEQLEVEDLKSILRAIGGFTLGGVKADLVQRLVTYVAAQPAPGAFGAEIA